MNPNYSPLVTVGKREHRSLKADCTSLPSVWDWVSTGLGDGYELVAERLLARSPVPVALTSLLLLVILSAVGVPRLHSVNDPESLWLPQDDPTLQAAAVRSALFGRANEECVVATAAAAGQANVLTRAGVLQLLQLHEAIAALRVEDPATGSSYAWPDLCVSAGPGQCLVFSPLGYFGFSRATIENMTDAQILEAASSPFPLPSVPLQAMVLGGAVVAGGPGAALVSVAALKSWYYLDDSDQRRASSPDWDSVLASWESAYLDLLAGPAAPDGPLRFYRSAARSEDDSMKSQQHGDLLALAPPANLCIIKFVFDLAQPCRASPPSRSLLASWGALAAAASILAALGITALLQIPFVPEGAAIPYFLLATCLYQMKVLVHALEDAEQRSGLRQACPFAGPLRPGRTQPIASALRAVAPLSLLSSVAAAAGLAVLGLWPEALPGVRWMCAVTVVALATGHVALVCLFAPACHLDSVWHTSRGFELGGPRSLSRALARLYSSAAFRSMGSRAAGAAAVCVVAALAIWSGARWRSELYQWETLAKGSYLREFQEVDFQYFGQLGVPFDVVLGGPSAAAQTGAIDYSSVETGRQLQQLSRMVQSAPAFGPGQGDPFWYDQFLEFCQSQVASGAINATLVDGTFPPPDLFETPFLDAFCDPGQNPAGFVACMQNVVRAGGPSSGPVVASRLSAFTSPVPARDEQVAAVEGLLSVAAAAREQLPLLQGEPVVFAPPFPIFRGFVLLQRWTISSFAVAAATLVVVAGLVLRPLAAAASVAGAALTCAAVVAFFLYPKQLPLDDQSLPSFLYLPYFAFAMLAHVTGALGRTTVGGPAKAASGPPSEVDGYDGDDDGGDDQEAGGGRGGGGRSSSPISSRRPAEGDVQKELSNPSSEPASVDPPAVLTSPSISVPLSATLGVRPEYRRVALRAGPALSGSVALALGLWISSYFMRSPVDVVFAQGGAIAVAVAAVSASLLVPILLLR